MTEAEYKELWLQKVPETQTEYNAARFSKDKLAYAKEWTEKNISEHNFYTDIILAQKYRMITDKEYCETCSQWADKISVYEKLKMHGLDSIALPYNCMHYGKMTLDDFKNLNGNYIAKCNHGSGWNKFFDTKTVNKQFIINSINEWQQLNYAYITGYEAQYENIKPGVIIQPIMNFSLNETFENNILLDYSFYCYEGKIISIALTKKISKAIERHIAFVDENGKGLKQAIAIPGYEMFNLTKGLMHNIDEMKPYVKEIAKLFNFVRVDMYHINGKVYFGETTFTPSSGRIILAERT